MKMANEETEIYIKASGMWKDLEESISLKLTKLNSEEKGKIINNLRKGKPLL